MGAGAGAAGGAAIPAATAAPAAPAATGMAMEGGWTMPAVTGGAQNLFAGPTATGAMNPGAPPSNVFYNNPKFYNALASFAGSMGKGGTVAGGAPSGPPGVAPGIHRGQWQQPAQGAPMTRLQVAGPDVGSGALAGSLPLWSGAGAPAQLPVASLGVGSGALSAGPPAWGVSTRPFWGGR